VIVVVRSVDREVPVPADHQPVEEPSSARNRADLPGRVTDMADLPLTIEQHADAPNELDGARGSTVVLVLTGDLDPHTAPMLSDAVSEHVDKGVVNLTLDLRGLEFVDSSGLRVIIATHRDLADASGRLTLRAPTESTRRLLEVTGLLDQLDIEDA
jgi:anti-anti-sigma factor